ncbi:hypothetical protein FZ103_04200 [Streptomonospora sp. PA3]|uniref:hypothetical protein n=1 Tax=Streptomonospora sp. PA3 TaxID=2607326 RepID=UPI0012DDE93C|nr:hypothetical protein [Streptomonospora sp. PA3]MUL40387.1 hypothetical protein [Streptomonospora sp. PA3]
MVAVDIAADLNTEDQTGYVWAFLDEARDPSIIVPGALVVAGDDDAPAVAVVVDLTPHPSGTVVRLDVLPGALEQYVALAKRVDAAA